MTTKALSFKGPPQVAIAANAVTPNPGITGVQVWSTIENSILTWNGSIWVLAGGGTALSSVTVNVPSAKHKLADVIVTVPAALETSTVVPWLVPNEDWDADDLSGYYVMATAQNGTVTFTIISEGPIAGNFKIAYILG